MHSANLEYSDRLIRVLDALDEAGKKGLTTRQIIRKASVCAVNTCISELRDNGVDVKCEQEGVGRFRYTLV